MSGTTTQTTLPRPGQEVRHPARSQATRVIHLLVLLTVLHQLIGSQFMQRPRPGVQADWLFSLHEYAGLAGLVLVAAFWAWTVVRHGETRIGRLLPWFSRAGVRDVLADLTVQIRRMAQGRVPEDDDGALASAVHGLGLLVLTAMALSGSVYFFAGIAPVASVAVRLHKLMSNLMWAYLVAHAGVAVLHHMFGSDIFSRMFWIRRRP
jgi:cytochrome b561